MLPFTCGEGKFLLNIKNSQNIMTIVVDQKENEFINLIVQGRCTLIAHCTERKSREDESKKSWKLMCVRSKKMFTG